MKGKVIINNQEIEIEINEEQLEQLKVKPKRTGYERLTYGQIYYYDDGSEFGDTYSEWCDNNDDENYEFANYYTDEELMQNNARADRLMRQLRRFAVENRKEKLDWNGENEHFCIVYNHKSYIEATVGLQITSNFGIHHFDIYFDTKETAQAALEKFKDELTWYFTEYKDSL